MQRVSLGKNSLKEAYNNAAFTTSPPTTSPYTGKWVCEENPSIVLTTQQLVSNYPNATAPEGTYVWQTTSAVISFDANGGTTTEPSIIQNGTSTAINLPRGEATTFRDGYQIVAWNIERDGSGTHYYLGQKVTPQQGKNLILYAQWKAIDDYPDKLVNGDFEHMDKALFSKTPNSSGSISNWTIMNPYEKLSTQTNGGCDAPRIRKELPDWMSEKDFGWHSKAETLPPGSDGIVEWIPGILIQDGVELRYESNGNIHGGIGAYDLYQDVKTQPSTLYKWSLKHASRDNSKKNNLLVNIGAPANTTAQDAWRTSANGFGDAVGYVGKNISTQNGNLPNDCDEYTEQWETYEGSYIVPDGQYLTRFAFCGSDATTPSKAGSVVDDITFSRAYPIYYDMNDASSTQKADRNGIYEDSQVADNGAQGYANEGEDTPLTGIVPIRGGYKFLGWSLEPLEELPVGTDVPAVSDKLVSSVSISEATTVYAVWQKNTVPLGYVIEGTDNLDRKGIYSDPVANDEQGFHEIGSTVKLTDIKPTRAAHEFLGWSTEKIGDIAYLDDAGAKAFLESDKHVNEIVMPQEGTRVYAVWQEKYSRKILNGGFEYPIPTSYAPITPDMDPAISRGTNICLSTENWTYTSGSGRRTTVLGPLNINKKQLAWESTAYDSRLLKTNYLALTQSIEYDKGNTRAGLIANSIIYQDILTEPGVLYKWSLKHGTAYYTVPSSARVLIGTEKTLIPQKAVCTKSNGNATAVLGTEYDTMTSDISHIEGINALHPSFGTLEAVTSNSDYTVWNSFEGSYYVPEGQFVSRFAFECVATPGSGDSTNQFDDIAFAKAYPLHFDVNGGTNKTIYTDPTANNYAGYHQEGEEVALPTSPDNLSAPTGYELIGWSEEKLPWIDENTADEEKTRVCNSVIKGTTYSMPAKEKTLYAVYAKMPSIHIDGTEGGSIEKKETTQTGFLLPSFDIEIEPDPGFRIEKILVDGKPLIDAPFSEGEAFTASLGDIVGDHTVSVEFRDMRIEMSETGSEGIVVLLLVGTMLIVLGSALIVRSTRGCFGSRNR